MLHKVSQDPAREGELSKNTVFPDHILISNSLMRLKQTPSITVLIIISLLIPPVTDETGAFHKQLIPVNNSLLPSSGNLIEDKLN